MPTDLKSYESSGTYIAAIARALQQLKQFEPVMAKAEPHTAQMLSAPRSQAWWSEQESSALANSILAVGGEALLQQVGQLAVTESISAVIRPLVTVLMALLGPSPATLFGRFGQLSQAAVKNVKCSWTSTSATSGELTVTYPLIIPKAYTALWLGSFEFVWTITKTVGQAIATHRGTSIHFLLSWGAQPR